MLKFRENQFKMFKSKILNSLSHNLKTPLNSIMGLSQVA
jgi:K+-sensing histidine kinase KdpD